MVEKPPQPDGSEPEGLTEEELEAQSGALLPDREAMSTLSPNVVVPSDPAAVADALLGEAHEHDGPEGEEPEGPEQQTP